MYYRPIVMATFFWIGMALLSATQQPDYCMVPSTGRPTLPAKLMDGMGRSDFKITTTSPEAQAFFNQGVSQLYAFWFAEAERSFMQAAAIDHDAGMAYWGIAISATGDFRPRYQTFLYPNNRLPLIPAPGSGYARARDAIAKARRLRLKLTEREGLYIDAVTARQNARARKPENDYVDAMRKVVAAFPDDADAQAILALELESGFDSTGKPRDGTEESIDLLNAVLSQHPEHVGALHFLIHALEGSGRAKDAWAASGKYPSLVPAIPHALHMPGHIYVQTGRFEDAVHAFEVAGAKERAYIDADALYPREHYLHNQQFLIYALSALGRFRSAVEESRKLMSVPENPRERSAIDSASSYRLGWFGLMRTLVRFERWDDILDGRTLPLYEKPRELIWFHWAQGLAHASKDDRPAARESLRLMNAAFERFKQIANPAPQQFYVARMELEAVIDNDLGALQKAATEQSEMLYAEPPSYPRPVLEQLGRLALRLENTTAAEKAYRALLESEPGSGRALRGLAQTLNRSGKTSEAESVATEFRKAWATADPESKEIPGFKPQ